MARQGGARLGKARPGMAWHGEARFNLKGIIMDIVTLIAFASAVLANIGTTIGLFLWATNRASEDTKEYRNQTMAILQAIQTEMKDFHGRLCTIEERNRKN